jgi:subtilase family serine protease
MSTYPMAACQSSTTPGDTGCYAWNTGTSMATPHVAGAAALIWSRSDVTSNSQVVDILLNSADGSGVSTVRLDSWTIHGGLNLHDAISYGLTNLPPDADAGPDRTVADSDRDGTELVTLDASGSSDSDGTIVGCAWREGGTLIGTGETAGVWLTIGVHTLTLEVSDDEGDTATDTVVITVTPANQVTVTASTPQATEAGTAAGVFTVIRTGDTSVPLSVHYTVGGTTVAGTDYVALPGTAVIQAGSSTANVSVTPVDDGAFESDESVILMLSVDAEYGVGSPATSTVTIVSDDLPPDLIVTAMAAPAIGGADSDVVVTDTTKNQGTGASLPSETGFYLSANSTLDAADKWIGNRTVSSLGAGLTAQASTTLRIPPSTSTGLYRILAKADWDNTVAESSETNNIRASGIINIGPDLTVSALTAPATAVAGGTISVSDTAKNQGGGTAGASTTRFYWSTNTALDASDQVMGSRSVEPLAGGASTSSTMTLTVPATAGAGSYYVIAQADGSSEVTETTETNNTRASAAIKVGPDLVVTAVSVPSSGAAGAIIAATESTKNQGAGPATASSTGFYLSVNSTISPDDEFIGSRSVGTLAANVTSTGQTFLQIPADTLPGSYYVVARTDWNGALGETSETNNDRPSGLIRIGGDLVLTSVSASSPVMAGGPITVTDTTKNQGSAPVGESTTAFYLSINIVYDAATDQFLGNRTVAALAASATSTVQTQLVVPAGTAAGRYYVIGVADANGVVAEGLENNNTRNSGIVYVGSDLTLTALTGPSSAVAGSSISAAVTTKNQGGDTAPASFTRFYLSSNNSLDASDPLVGAREVSALGPGQSEAGVALLPIPASTPAGTYYIIAKADGEDAIAESQETNNLRSKSISIAAAP